MLGAHHPFTLAGVDAVIADLDGTLCDVSEILHLVDPPLPSGAGGAPSEGERNFHAFHAASADCPSVEAVVEAVRAAKSTGRDILVVTGREFIWRDLTLDWLAKHDIPYDELLMRIVGDYRPDHVIKAEMLDDLEKRGWTVTDAWEDRDDIADLWASRGITVHRV
jgi:phosphoglycolate phosphatase-like HAD superfamily hydrolase